MSGQIPGVPVIAPIQSTAGAIPVRNEKGQVSMQKVKVNRYISGKRPDYAPRSSSEGESEDEEFIVPSRLKPDPEGEGGQGLPMELSEAERLDPRLRRLQQNVRRIEKPEILSESESEEERPGRHYETDSDSDGELEEDVEIEHRRIALRQKVLDKLEEGELLTKEEEQESESEESESEYEEYTDSEEELRPRLKPVFVKKVERVTIKPPEAVEVKSQVEVAEAKKEERRTETLKLVEVEILRDKTGGKKQDDVDAMANVPKLTDVNTDDENEEAEYEAWKLRELKRIKRDRDEREAIERDRMELDRIHNLTEDERRLEMKLKPKVIVNKALKGKYKFLQKYYHRGVFYLDKEEDVLKRDNSMPTLEDHFDKTIIPKVMQVKNFGRSGRTKYTHLVDQDTTNFESAWVSETNQSVKFHSTQAAGVRQVFERPTQKKRKLEEDNM